MHACSELNCVSLYWKKGDGRFAFTKGGGRRRVVHVLDAARLVANRAFDVIPSHMLAVAKKWIQSVDPIRKLHESNRVLCRVLSNLRLSTSHLLKSQVVQTALKPIFQICGDVAGDSLASRAETDLMKLQGKVDSFTSAIVIYCYSIKMAIDG